MVIVGLVCCGRPSAAADAGDGKALLERNCGRCHAVAAGTESPLKNAPNLWVVLGTYPGSRLEVELGEGKGSRHREMPQIQFSEEEIASIYYYLHGEGIGNIPANEETGPAPP
jgi:mono/diheme cytochrome c family protein